MKLPAIDRRTLLIGGGAGVGLVVGFLAWPRREGSPLAPGRKDRLVNAYLRIGSDERVTIAVPQAEVGQGLWTGLAQVAADEPGAGFAQSGGGPGPPGRGRPKPAGGGGGLWKWRLAGTFVGAARGPCGAQNQGEGRHRCKPRLEGGVGHHRTPANSSNLDRIRPTW